MPRLPPISHLTTHFPLPPDFGRPDFGPDFGPDCGRDRDFFDRFRFVAPAPKKRRRRSLARAVLPKLHSWPLARPANFPIHPLPEDKIPPHQLPPLRRIYLQIAAKQYSAPALDPDRAHLSVYEYQVGSQWIIWDHETGNVLLTSLWRAAQQHSPQADHDKLRAPPKADIVKLLESTPKELHASIKRVRGGFLKIQGTWVPHALCRRLARRFCYYIRFQLVPLFGADFPAECLAPGDAGFGELRYGRASGGASARGARTYSFSDAAPPSARASFSRGAAYTIAPPRSEDPQRSPLDPHRSPLDPHRSPLDSQRSPLASAKNSTNVPRVPASPELSYSEMMDIVNASRCLQRLSQSGPSNKMSIDHILS